MTADQCRSLLQLLDEDGKMNCVRLHTTGGRFDGSPGEFPNDAVAVPLWSGNSNYATEVVISSIVAIERID